MSAHTHDGIDWVARLADLRQADQLDAPAMRVVARRLVDSLPAPTPPAPRPTVLDVGSGAGGMSAALAVALAERGGGTLVLIDAVPELLAAAAEAATAAIATAMAMPRAAAAPATTPTATTAAVAPTAATPPGTNTAAQAAEPATTAAEAATTTAATATNTAAQAAEPATTAAEAATATNTAASPAADAAATPAVAATTTATATAAEPAATAAAPTAAATPTAAAAATNTAAVTATATNTAAAADTATPTAAGTNPAATATAATTNAAAAALFDGAPGDANVCVVEVRTLLADLSDPGQLVGLPPADLVWASNVLHHLPDQQLGVRSLVGLLAPGGRLALSEGGLSVRCLPWDVGVGEPGLPDRLAAAHATWFRGMRTGMPGSVRMPVGWNRALTDAGLTGVSAFSFLVDAPAPGSDLVRASVVRWLTWMARATDGLLDADDAAAVHRLLDPGDPAFVGARDDVFLLTANTVHYGVAP